MKKRRWHKAINIAVALVLAGMLILAYVPLQPAHAAPDPGWWDAHWSHRAPITITNTGGALTNYQIKVTVSYDSDMQSDFDDLRFTNASGTPLDYWIESKTDGSSATVWVEVDSIAASGNTTIYIYYGNPAATDASDGDNTFIFYDSFEVDLSKWTEINSGHGTATRVTTPTAQHGTYCVKLEDTSTTTAFGIYATFTSQSICIIEFYARVPQTDRVSRIRVKDSGNTIGPFLRFNASSKVQHKVAGTWTDTTLTYSADTWYKFKLTEVDTTDHTYDIWIDDVLKQDDAGFSDNATDISRLDFILHKAKTLTSYVDLIIVRQYASPEPTPSFGSEEKNWESYNDAAHQNQDDLFGEGENTVYMFGEGFVASTAYHVGYYDGDNAKILSDGVSSNSTGELSSLCYFPTYQESAVAGTWHAVVYQDSVASPPETYTADDPNSVVEDSFEVTAQAIPEFPTVMAGIAVAGLCCGIYFWMRRRRVHD